MGRALIDDMDAGGYVENMVFINYFNSALNYLRQHNLSNKLCLVQPE